MRHLLIVISVTAVACGSPDDVGSDEAFGGDAVVSSGGADGLGVTAEEASAILRVANEASQRVLDDDVRLDARAAANIVTARSLSPITTLDELDAVPWVGPAAFRLFREYVVQHGLVGPERECLIISEYIEGKTDKNKAVEVMNCGATPLDLSGISICLIRNDDDDCTLSAPLGTHTLGPSETLTMCRQRDGQWKNPEVWIRDRCELEIGSVAIFSGDDRLALVRDRDGDGAVSVDRDDVLDVLGRITYRPWDSPWNDVRLQRCRLEPNDGRGFYATLDWFEVHSWSSGAGGDLGIPPSGTGCR